MNFFSLLLNIVVISACAEANFPTGQIQANQQEVGVEKEVLRTQPEITTFSSPKGGDETCKILSHLPGGHYSKKDIKREEKLCSIDIYAEGIAVCPKTWSTSPATMVYDLRKSSYSSDEYEASEYCGHRGKKKGKGVKTAAKIKTTMHQTSHKGTSGTYSKSSLMYYGLSRFFDTKVKVPVAVYREMDVQTYRDRGTAELGASRSKGTKIRNGWYWMDQALSGNYEPNSHIYTSPQKTTLYGAMLKGPGERYGPIFNGTRVSGWGQGDNLDFQKTPAAMALRTAGNLVDVIPSALSSARSHGKNKKMIASFQGLDGIQGQQQMVFWMRELIEINLLDFIFSQQDRVGNIDYLYYWYYVKDGKVRSKEVEQEYDNKERDEFDSIEVTIEEDDGFSIAKYNPILVQRTFLNDNDAGTYVKYSNFSKKVGHLKEMRHFSLKLYRKLAELHADLQTQGPIYQWAKNEVRLSADDLEWFVKNTELAFDSKEFKKGAADLKGQCESGNMQFDLDEVKSFMINGPKVTPASAVDCATGQLKSE